MLIHSSPYAGSVGEVSVEDLENDFEFEVASEEPITLSTLPAEPFRLQLTLNDSETAAATISAVPSTPNSDPSDVYVVFFVDPSLVAPCAMVNVVCADSYAHAVERLYSFEDMNFVQTYPKVWVRKVEVIEELQYQVALTISAINVDLVDVDLDDE